MPRTIQRPKTPQYTTGPRRQTVDKAHSFASTSRRTRPATPTPPPPPRKRTLRNPKPCQELQEDDKDMSRLMSRHRGGTRSQTNSTSYRPRSQSAPSIAGDASSRVTRTGRLSKALKGLPVHFCDACGKVYTRAEHLRRHQLSHNDPTLTCPLPGCSRQFFREDLLSRHIEDHRPSRSPTQFNNFYPPATTMDSSNNSSQQHLEVPQNTPLEVGSMNLHRTVSEPLATVANATHAFYHPQSPTAMYSPLTYTWQPNVMNPTSTYSTSASPTYTTATYGPLPANTIRSPMVAPNSYEFSHPEDLTTLTVDAHNPSFDLYHNNIPSTQSDISYQSYATAPPYQEGMYSGPMSSMDPALEHNVMGQPRSLQEMGYFSNLLDEAESRAFQE